MTEVKELIPGGETIGVDKNNRWGSKTDHMEAAENVSGHFSWLDFCEHKFTQFHLKWSRLMPCALFSLKQTNGWLSGFFFNTFCSWTEIIMCLHSWQLVSHCFSWRTGSCVLRYKYKKRACLKRHRSQPCPCAGAIDYSVTWGSSSSVVGRVVSTCLAACSAQMAKAAVTQVVPAKSLQCTDMKM